MAPGRLMTTSNPSLCASGAARCQALQVSLSVSMVTHQHIIWMPPSLDLAMERMEDDRALVLQVSLPHSVTRKNFYLSPSFLPI